MVRVVGWGGLIILDLILSEVDFFRMRIKWLFIFMWFLVIGNVFFVVFYFIVGSMLFWLENIKFIYEGFLYCSFIWWDFVCDID